MSDVVVTVPKDRWTGWLHEGDLPGQETFPCFMRTDPGHERGCSLCHGTGRVSAGETEWEFHLGGPAPQIEPGERVYVVAHGRLRGWAPLVAVTSWDYPGEYEARRGCSLIRRGAAVACTIAEPIRGFQAWRYRWWEREAEIAFPDWQTAGVVAA